MTQAEFQSQISRLVSVYGDKAYPLERVRIIWREMKNCGSFEFENIVSELIGTCSYAPMVEKFRDARQDLFSKNSCEYEQNLRSWIAAQPMCSYCEKLGYITARKRNDGSTWVFACKCDVAARLYPKYPKWSNARYLDEFSPEFRLVSSPQPADKSFDPSKLFGGLQDLNCVEPGCDG